MQILAAIVLVTSIAFLIMMFAVEKTDKNFMRMTIVMIVQIFASVSLAMAALGILPTVHW